MKNIENLAAFVRFIEIDCLVELPDGVRFIEIKSSETLLADHIKNILSLNKLFPKTENYLIYAGREEPVYQDVKFINWQNIEFLNKI